MLDKIKKAAQIVDLVMELQNLDADKDGKKDLAEFLVLGGKLAAEYGELMDTFNELARLFGDDVSAIKQRLGVS